MPKSRPRRYELTAESALEYDGACWTYKRMTKNRKPDGSPSDRWKDVCYGGYLDEILLRVIELEAVALPIHKDRPHLLSLLQNLHEAYERFRFVYTNVIKAPPHTKP
jgi:hypothetical protein